MKTTDNQTVNKHGLFYKVIITDDKHTVVSIRAVKIKDIDPKNCYYFHSNAVSEANHLNKQS